MATAFDLLHREIQRKLWDMRWTELRPIQRDAIVHLMQGGRDTVIASPTASGKTEAAFLPILSAIADAPHGSVKALYVGPLKALINDQFGRLEDLCERLEMPVTRWHGDVDATRKQRVFQRPAGIVLITPESLESILINRAAKVATTFAGLEYVVIDEMHAFIGTERGAQLLSLLHRLTLRAKCDPIRIGLSATLGDDVAVLTWLRPGGTPAKLISDKSEAPLGMRFRGMWKPAKPTVHEAGEDTEAEAEGLALRQLARSILSASHGQTNLVFANEKAHIELLADALIQEVIATGLPDDIVVHHGSLSREQRHASEEQLRASRPCTAVCSNTLELGIDIGTIDDVIQVSAPWSVASLKQRVGRSGRRAGRSRTLRGYFMESVPDVNSDLWARLHLNFLQGVAIAELMLQKFVEPPRLGRAHLSTVVHQTLALIAEGGGAKAPGLFRAINGSGAFGPLDQAQYGQLIRELGRHELLAQMGDGTLVLGPKGEVLVDHYTFFAAFRASQEMRVVHGSDVIGSVANPPAVGEYLILGGRRWCVESIDVERHEIAVSRARGAKAPTFNPWGGRVHKRVHQRMRELLLTTKVPSYLDEGAAEILAAARQEAARLKQLPIALVGAASVTLFVFAGSQIQQTLFLALSHAGLQVADRRVGFEVTADTGSLERVLRRFAANPNLGALADMADRIHHRRELGGERFDEFVHPGLWQEAFAREELDAEGAREVALAAAEAMAAGGVPAIALLSV